jgi:hypothetical protein
MRLHWYARNRQLGLRVVSESVRVRATYVMMATLPSNVIVDMVFLETMETILGSSRLRK